MVALVVGGGLAGRQVTESSMDKAERTPLGGLAQCPTPPSAHSPHSKDFLPLRGTFCSFFEDFLLVDPRWVGALGAAWGALQTPL